MSLEDVIEKIGPIEQGKQLQIAKLTIPELQVLMECKDVAKNQKKRLMKRIKWLEHEDESLGSCIKFENFYFLSFENP